MSAPSEKQQPKQPQPQPQPQPQQQQETGGFGWSWSKLGTNLLASAANITSQMIETVESTLGAPDPTELAAKIAKDEAEKAALAETQKAEGGWEFENENDNDWFSMDKIASTVSF